MDDLSQKSYSWTGNELFNPFESSLNIIELLFGFFVELELSYLVI